MFTEIGYDWTLWFQWECLQKKRPYLTFVKRLKIDVLVSLLQDFCYQNFDTKNAQKSFPFFLQQGMLTNILCARKRITLPCPDNHYMKHDHWITTRSVFIWRMIGYFSSFWLHLESRVARSRCIIQVNKLHKFELQYRILLKSMVQMLISVREQHAISIERLLYEKA